MSLTGVATEGFLNKVNAIQDGTVVDPDDIKIDYFKVGTLAHAGSTPTVPDPTRTGIEDAVNMFQKSLIPANIVDDGDGLLDISCVLTVAEGNGFTYWEIGIFSVNNIMLYYCTFDGWVKTIAAQMRVRVRVRNHS